MIGPSCLPLGLEAILIPREAKRFLDETVNAEGSAVGDAEATLKVAKVLANAFGYSIEVSAVHILLVFGCGGVSLFFLLAAHVA